MVLYASTRYPIHPNPRTHVAPSHRIHPRLPLASSSGPHSPCPHFDRNSHPPYLRQLFNLRFFFPSPSTFPSLPYLSLDFSRPVHCGYGRSTAVTARILGVRDLSSRPTSVFPRLACILVHIEWDTYVPTCPPAWDAARSSWPLVLGAVVFSGSAPKRGSLLYQPPPGAFPGRGLPSVCTVRYSQCTVSHRLHILASVRAPSA